MTTLSKDQIKEIADLLDSGLKCYYNKKTHEVKEILDFESMQYVDDESLEWKELIDDLEEHFEDYVEFVKMPNRESFQVMTDFVDKVDDEEFKKRLIWSLNRSHPFSNFKDEIDYNGEYRERWFKFKANKYIEHVENQIQEYNQLEEFSENEEEQEKQEDLGK